MPSHRHPTPLPVSTTLPRAAAIHFVCVPGIIWSLLVWLAAAGPLAPLPQAPALAAALARLPPWLARCAAPSPFWRLPLLVPWPRTPPHALGRAVCPARDTTPTTRRRSDHAHAQHPCCHADPAACCPVTHTHTRTHRPTHTHMRACTLGHCHMHAHSRWCAHA
jgi:hypothetical protein